MSDTVLSDEQLAVSKMLEASDRLEEAEAFNPDTVLDDVSDGGSDAASSEKMEKLAKVQDQAVQMLAGHSLLLVQLGFQWKTGNTNIKVNQDLQKQFAELLPPVLDEWGFTAPDIFEKYGATMAAGMTLAMIIGDMSAQNTQYKQQLMQGAENGEKAEVTVS